jgi:hypothetical protein
MRQKGRRPVNIQQLNRFTDEQVTAMVGDETRTDLAERITMTDPVGTTFYSKPAPRRRRLLLGMPVAAGLAAAALVATSVGKPEQKLGPISIGPLAANAAPLSITQQGGYLTVRVTNPNVDPARYRREFTAYGLDVDLRLQPVAPPDAGKVLFVEDDGPSAGVRTITTRTCGTDACGVGVKIPLHYKWFVRVIFGRTPAPHGSYQTGTGVVLDGVTVPDVRGTTVARARARLAAGHISSLSYRYEYRGSDQPYPDGVPTDKVQSGWYVHDYALSDTPGQLILFVGPDNA